MAKKVAVVLSGCGFKDGTEITEAVATLISLTQAGAEYKCFAPDQEVVGTDHLTGKPSNSRNLMHEAARICRGEIQSLEELNPQSFDAVVFPGGYGAALNLSTWGKEGSKGSVLPQVERIIREFNNQSKPIGVICIAPTLVAKVLGSKNITLTIGEDRETALEIEKTGARHENCPVADYVTDRENKVISTPAYMYGQARPHEVFQGVQGLVKELVEMA
jgi:enhancing lycopene biosynthesis protein 2